MSGDEWPWALAAGLRGWLRVHRELPAIEPVTSLARAPRDADEASSETT